MQGCVNAPNQVLRRWLRGQTTSPEAEFDAAVAATVELFTGPGGAKSEESNVFVELTVLERRLRCTPPVSPSAADR